MAKDAKYGQVEVPGIPEDEPIFILRGKDPLVPAIVTQYAHKAMAEYGHAGEEDESIKIPDGFVEGCGSVAEAMRDYQRELGDKVHLPD